MSDTVTFDALGQVQQLRLTTSAGRRLEKSVGVPYGKLMKEIEDRIGFDLVVAFFAACLRDGKGVPEARAEEIIDEIGGLQAASDMMVRTITAGMPDAAPEEGGGKGKGKA